MTKKTKTTSSKARKTRAEREAAVIAWNKKMRESKAAKKEDKLSQQLSLTKYVTPAKPVPKTYTSQDAQTRVIIEDHVYQEVMHYVNASDFEVSGVGNVIVEKTDGDTIFRVISCHLLPQVNTRAHTEIDAAAMAKLEYQERATPGELRWWWHSHVDMAVFWSGEDRSTIEELSAAGWFTATVFNKKREVRSAYAQGGAVPFMLDELITEVKRVLDPKLVESWDAKYKEMCKNRTYTSSSLYGGLSARDYTWAEGEEWEQEYERANAKWGGYVAKKSSVDDRTQDALVKAVALTAVAKSGATTPTSSKSELLEEAEQPVDSKMAQYAEACWMSVHAECGTLDLEPGDSVYDKADEHAMLIYELALNNELTDDDYKDLVQVAQDEIADYRAMRAATGLAQAKASTSSAAARTQQLADSAQMSVEGAASDAGLPAYRVEFLGKEARRAVLEGNYSLADFEMKIASEALAQGNVT